MQLFSTVVPPAANYVLCISLTDSLESALYQKCLLPPSRQTTHKPLLLLTQQLSQSDSRKQGPGHHRWTFPLLGPLHSRFPAVQMQKKKKKSETRRRKLPPWRQPGSGTRVTRLWSPASPFDCVTFISGAYPFLFSRLGEVFILLCLVTKCPREETSCFMDYHTFLLCFLMTWHTLEVLCLFILFILSSSWPHNNGDFRDQRVNQFEHWYLTHTWA